MTVLVLDSNIWNAIITNSLEVGSAPDFKRNFQAAEDEKKTLNRLLRMAIEQKLALTQRLEDAEFEIESLRQYESQASSQTKKTRNHSSRSLRN